MRIRVDVSRPIYQQMIDEVKRAIARGELKPGDKLPSHRDMAQEIRVNPNTVQRAYREMEQGGLVQTLRG
ncbi:MAG: GntR family transcriptional regulator, partial [Bacillota bacterium]